MNILAALVGWAMIIWRLPRVQLGSAHSRYTFATLVCFTLAASFTIPFIDNWLDGATGLPAVSLILEYLFAIAAAVVWALSCLSLDDSLSSRRWLIWLAPIVLAAMLLTWWIFLPELALARSDTANGELLITSLVQAYALAIVVTIAVPALSSQVANEQALPVRIRLLCILATQLILAVWLGARAMLGPLVLVGILPRSISFSFINVLVGLMILAYTASLLPPAVLVNLSRKLVHIRDWYALACLRRVERHTAALLGARAIEISLAEARDTPDYALYRVAIAILDRRKALMTLPNRDAQAIADRLNRLVVEVPDYFRLLRRLQTLSLK